MADRPMAHQAPQEQARARRHAQIAAQIEALSRGRAGWPVTSWPRSRRDPAGFTDDLRGLSPALRLVAQGVAVSMGVFALPEAQALIQGSLGQAAYFLAIGTFASMARMRRKSSPSPSSTCSATMAP